MLEKYSVVGTEVPMIMRHVARCTKEKHLGMHVRSKLQQPEGSWDEGLRMIRSVSASVTKKTTGFPGFYPPAVPESSIYYEEGPVKTQLLRGFSWLLDLRSVPPDA